MSTAQGWQQQAVRRWQALSARDRLAATVGTSVLGVLILWLLAVQPAWRTVREVPAQIDAVEAQLQAMRALAAETTSLRGATPVSQAQAAAALQAATEQLGDKGKLVIQGDRATLTLTAADTASLRAWLELARSAARARPLEAQLSRGPAGYAGTLVVSFGGGT